jgi:hypothetical protein
VKAPNRSEEVAGGVMSGEGGADKSLGLISSGKDILHAFQRFLLVGSLNAQVCQI